MREARRNILCPALPVLCTSFFLVFSFYNRLLSITIKNPSEKKRCFWGKKLQPSAVLLLLLPTLWILRQKRNRDPERASLFLFYIFFSINSVEATHKKRIYIYNEVIVFFFFF
jgi:hypothetical protein